MDQAPYTPLSCPFLLFFLNAATIQAISSSLMPTMGERITAARGMSCMGLSITDSRLNMVSTSTVLKYPVLVWALAGIPSFISTLTKTSDHPVMLRRRITISPSLALRYASFSLSHTSSPLSLLTSSRIRLAVILASNSLAV